MTQKTPAELRAEAEEQLRPLGLRRLKLLAQLDEINQEIRPLVVEAVRMEVTYRRIYALTGVASNTARAWERSGPQDGPDPFPG